jgi:hypothetical protein
MDASLNRLWTSNGTTACSASDVQSSPSLASDGSGGAWVAWLDARSASDNRIYYNRVSASNTVQFGDLGQLLFQSIDILDQPLLAPVPGGGIWLVASSDDGASFSDLDARRLDENGVAVVYVSIFSTGTSNLRALDPSLVVDPQGNAYVAYTTLPTGQGADYTRVFVESLTLDGFDRWGTTGVEVQAFDSFREVPTLYLDAATGIYCVYEDLRFGGSLYAQRFDFLGNRLWSEDGVAVATAPGAQSSPVILPTDGNSIIVAFDDERSGDLEIYAQRVDVYGLTGDPAPAITSVADAPQDQGGVLLVDWDASDRDTVLDSAIDDYLVWRRLQGSLKRELSAEAKALAIADGIDAAVVALLAGQGWEYVAATPAIHTSTYSASVPSYGDSTSAPGPVTEIQVVARTAAGGFFTSATVSGTSVDNLAPPAPQDVVALSVGDAVVSWSALVLSDLSQYVVYRGSTSDFTPGPATRLGSTTIPQFVDVSPLAGPSYYRVSAVDIHENEGAASAAVPLQSATAADGPPQFSTRILSSSPNPFNPRTTVRFEVGSSSWVRLTIHDVRGRRVATLLDSDLDAGGYSRTWEGIDELGWSVASGTYLVLLRVGGEVRTTKVTLVE